LLHLLAFCVRQFSDKYLKKWYLLPAGRHRTRIPSACLEGEFLARARDHIGRQVRAANARGKIRSAA
jgi:hypothetical protein